MSYRNLMRNAAKLLFVVAVAIFFGTVLFAFLTVFNSGPLASRGLMAMLAALVGGVTMAIPPFVGAAIIWRLDIWLFERGDRP